MRGDVDTEGEVSFRETRRGTTMMHVVLGYNPPAGRLGALVASLFGSDPEQQLEEDLERFARVAEQGRRRRRARRRDERYRTGPPRRERQAYERRDDRLRDERRLDFDEDWDERLGRPPMRDREDASGERWRHAMTPRERERERRERKPDFDYSRETLRRGVDRLMDEPPSRRYRRWD
ncbi:MAG: hypothetical protein ICV60_15170 [Pyrinomonadaceae bacterium]|nr:hypothetical protein [Pyrinomonadaceae bacterium]